MFCSYLHSSNAIAEVVLCCVCLTNTNHPETNVPNIPHTYMPHSHDTSNNAYLLRPNGVLQRKMILLMSAGKKSLRRRDMSTGEVR